METAKLVTVKDKCLIFFFCWMWDFTEFSPPNTTRQLEHLQRNNRLEIQKKGEN